MAEWDVVPLSFDNRGWLGMEFGWFRDWTVLPFLAQMTESSVGLVRIRLDGLWMVALLVEIKESLPLKVVRRTD